MKGKQLVTPQRKRIRCETYTCKGMSGYSVGLRGFSPAYRNLCPSCMDEIVRQAGVLLYGEGWTPETGIYASTGNEPPKTSTPEVPAGSLGESVDDPNGKSNIPDPLDEAATASAHEKIDGDPLLDDPLLDDPLSGNPEPDPEVNAPTPEADPSTQANTPLPDKDGDHYVCKDCGAKFEKPSAKMEYVSHRRTCSKKQEAK